MSIKRILTITAAAAAVGVALAGCTAADPTAAPSSSASMEKIVIGSQAFSENEIVAEIYAQALETAGYSVERKFNIGSREVYIPAIESGEVSLLPEYTGGLLQYFDTKTTLKTAADIYGALPALLEPSGLAVLDQSTASDEDSYNVTKAFSEANNVTSLSDLSALKIPLTVGGNSELETRPYGPAGLLSIYGVTVSFTSIEDYGGPLTVKALNDGAVQIADLYTSDPAISKNGFVTLSDPESLMVANNVVALINKASFPKDAKGVINSVNAKLTTAGLVQINTESAAGDSPATIAAKWLKANQVG
ncbi:ABC transporter substrate-binding protein [Alpinimonas psychrophila]|uniref:Osmoprotectant transport system substrate-binding protein n=1 Tax=Alpinimonas psychrophila TaxID=748908 RepID=A0A7W3JSW1_9MICO|nr:ABC transporter substrate-binding protein [Alpinimonas psychrophila]MBA8828643.1 osmoprotectant transport system substrate-binding protein [Alpinimonas psychrophila]